MYFSQHSLWLSLFGASPTFAAIGLNQFYIPGGAANNGTKMLCGNMASWSCKPPSMCGWDDLLGKWYCCVPGKAEVCYTAAKSCQGKDKKTPGPNQQGCSSGVNAFCCHKERETCTQAFNQINICWSTSPNILERLNATKINETYASLRSAFPSASSYTIDRAALFQFTSKTASSTSPTAARNSAITTEVSTPQQHDAVHHEYLSGRAIGGVVGSVIGGVAFIIVASFLLWRRRRGGDKDDSNSLLHDRDPATAYKPETEHRQASATQYSHLAVSH